MDITKEDFRRYEEVRVSGVTNMFAVGMVSSLTGLPRNKIFEIMERYTELKLQLGVVGE